MSIINFPTFGSQKEWLLDQLENTASWRDTQAEEYPDDSRNGICANTLRRTATVVRGMPETHALFRALGSIDQIDDGDLNSWLDEVNYQFSRAGFHRQNSPEDVISELLEITEKALQDRRE